MFHDLFSNATLVDWILLVGLTAGLVLRGIEWYFRQSKLADDAAQYVTRKELEQELEIRRLKHDDEIKHWARSALGQYVHIKQWEDLTRRVERVEDKE